MCKMVIMVIMIARTSSSHHHHVIVHHHVISHHHLTRTSTTTNKGSNRSRRVGRRWLRRRRYCDQSNNSCVVSPCTDPIPLERRKKRRGMDTSQVFVILHDDVSFLCCERKCWGVLHLECAKAIVVPRCDSKFHHQRILLLIGPRRSWYPLCIPR